MLIYNYTSYAKVNLGLRVLNKRSNGYHNLHSLFLEVDLCDELIFSPSDAFQLTVEGPPTLEIPLDKNNLISKAYRMLKEKMELVPLEYAIHLKKLIPLGSGLGGGSSNAACTLKTLNKLCKLNLSHHELLDLGLKVGSDVPFFIEGGIKLIKGRGEIIEKYTASILKSLFFKIPPKL